jgi:UDP:flavonoid glycosyltransferase YjiC (YdhE family)
MRELIWSLWPACTQADPDNPSRPFRASAIIASPHTFGALCCAERLKVRAPARPTSWLFAASGTPYAGAAALPCMQVPLHLVSQLPVTPTALFPHPMATVKSINVGSLISSLPSELISGAANFYSYKAFDLYLWAAMKHHVDAFRNHLGLPAYPPDALTPAHALHGLRLPISYLWSPVVLPRPSDWGNHVQVRLIHAAVTCRRVMHAAATCMLPHTAVSLPCADGRWLQVCGMVPAHDESESFRPHPVLAAFLEYPKPPPIYIGFGAMAVPDPVALTELVYEVARASGKRILLSRGWADLGAGVKDKPDNVCLVGNVPHSWLLPRCHAAVHHGGAGTTAAALRAGLPTLVVRRTMHRCMMYRARPRHSRAAHACSRGAAPPPHRMVCMYGAQRRHACRCRCLETSSSGGTRVLRSR